LETGTLLINPRYVNIKGDNVSITLDVNHTSEHSKSILPNCVYPVSSLNDDVAFDQVDILTVS